MARSKVAFKPSRQVYLMTTAILCIGVAIVIPVHLKLWKNGEDFEQKDFRFQVNEKMSFFRLQISSIEDEARELGQILSRENGSLIPNNEFLNIRSAVVSTDSPITSITMSEVITIDQIEAYEEEYNVTVVPLRGDTFRPNQTTFVLIRRVGEGLERFIHQDTYSSDINDILYEDAFRGQIGVGRPNGNPGTGVFSFFIFVAIPGSFNKVDPTLPRYTASVILSVDALFTPFTSDGVFSVDVVSRGTTIYAEGSTTCTKEFTSCEDLSFGSDSWEVCICAGDEFQNTDYRNLVIVLSAIICLFALLTIGFVFLTDYKRFHHLQGQLEIQQKVSSFVCHEIRHPVQTLSLNTFLAEQDEFSEEMDSYVTIVRKNIGKIEDVLRDTLESDRLMLGSFVPRPSPVHVGPWLEEFFREMVVPKPITLYLVIEHHLDRIFIDRNRVEQMIFNLMTNAAKHVTQTEDDGLTIGKVFIVVFVKDGFLFVRISNLSEGSIPPVETLFHPPPTYPHMSKMRTEDPILIDSLTDVVEGVPLSFDSNGGAREFDMKPPPSYKAQASIGWGLTIVKMLALGMGGDFLIKKRGEWVHAIFRIRLVREEV